MKASILILVLFIMCCPGCATIISGNQQEISVTSSPPGATVTCANGNIINTPGTVTLSTKKVHMLIATYPNCEPQQVMLRKKLNNWLFCDILWDFGIITIPIDLISGAACELAPKNVHFSFTINPADQVKKPIGYKVDTSRKDAYGHYIKVPVYEDEK